MESDTKTNVESNEPARALFFELEFLATSGRAFLYDAVKTVLSDHGIKLAPVIFAQYFAPYSLPSALKRLGRAHAVDALASVDVLDTIQAAYVRMIKDDDHRNKGLITLTHDLLKHGIELGAVTCLDRESVADLLAKLNLDASAIHVLAAQDHGKAFPTAQDWLTLAKQMNTSTTLCTVAATSAAACGSALCAGMRCFAVPDSLTSFQDFSGADYVIESLDGAAEKLVLKLVEAF